MKIISFGLDNSVLNKKSVLAKKTVEYGDMVEKYYMVVPADSDKIVDLSSKTRVYGVGGACRLIKLWKMQALARAIVKKYKCKVITSQDPFELGFLAWRLKRKFKIAWNVQEHGDFFSQKYWRSESIINFFRYYLGRFLIKKADSVRVVSQRIKEYLINNLRINKEKIVVVPVLTEYNNSNLQNTVKSLNNEGKFVFLNMGRFVKQKNLPMLLRAFSNVNKKYANTSLYLIGKGFLKKDLLELIKEYKLESAVIMKDWVDNIYDYFEMADAYVLSSNYEGWGRVVVEAAATKLPIVMTDVGCAGELVKNNSALIVSVEDEDELTEAMIEIIENEELRIKNSDRAFESYKGLPNKKETLRLYKESWEKAVRQSRMKN